MVGRTATHGEFSIAVAFALNHVIQVKSVISCAAGSHKKHEEHPPGAAAQIDVCTAYILWMRDKTGLLEINGFNWEELSSIICTCNRHLHLFGTVTKVFGYYCLILSVNTSIVRLDCIQTGKMSWRLKFWLVLCLIPLSICVLHCTQRPYWLKTIISWGFDGTES